VTPPLLRARSARISLAWRTVQQDLPTLRLRIFAVLAD
jgi:hypothetical protein